MKNRLLNVMYIGVLLFASSCASILNPKNQNVTIYTSSESTLYVDNGKLPQLKSQKVKLARDANARQIKVEREGYKPEYDVMFQKRKSFLYGISWIPFGVVYLIPPLLDHGPKSRNYDKEVAFNCKQKLPVKMEDDKYLFLSKTSFDIQEKNIKISSYRHLKRNGTSKFKEEISNVEDLKIDNTIFTETFNKVLEDQGFSNEDKSILKSKTNTMYLSGKVDQVDFKLHDVANYGAMDPTFLVTEVSIQVELADVYGVVKNSKRITASSGRFSADIMGFGEVAESRYKKLLIKSLEDAIVSAFINFMNHGDVKELMKVEKMKNSVELNALNVSSLSKRHANNLGEAQKATVIIQTEEGHGSGCVISNNGHIITNYHVFAGQDESEITVLVNDSSYKAEILRVSEDHDVALLKVSSELRHSFDITTFAKYTVGQDIFAIGTPQTIELGQTLSKGIISGLREKEGASLIQTDVSVNAGNSGGPLVNKEGEIIGIVTSKLSGFGVEGISFCIPMEKAMQYLKLE
ncbi:trypsin-like peptidase domain-containing protein [Flammeovirgaceae bacterium SG7u.111]|nr:trypsin-like peptidase domain-containing protein [Flammeovirgaceae bacterium SG7u.132]WPO36452.1 trypsin-like peptidase domain-containing protein [Flammeovirgaceae bacterium SG7u.111]